MILKMKYVTFLKAVMSPVRLIVWSSYLAPHIGIRGYKNETACIRKMIVQWHDYVELFEMNEDNIIDANEGLNEFDDNLYGPFLIGIFGL